MFENELVKTDGAARAGLFYFALRSDFMTFKTYEINVDLVNDTSTTNTVRFSQNDRNSAKLLLSITNKGTELDLSQAKAVRMSFKKPDGTRVFQNDCKPINVLKGKYQILLKTQTLTAVGNVIAQVHIEEEDRTIDTQKFLFVVNESLASDEAVESTNEFTIIQKAIEAGKKLEGKDIDGMIAAGVKVDAAVKKSGDTMTGNLKLDRVDDTKYRDIQWLANGVSDIALGQDIAGNWRAFDSLGNQTIFAYRKGTKTFDVIANTNLLKKTGDTVTGHMTFKGSMIQEISDGTKGIQSVISSSKDKWMIAPKVNGVLDWSKEFSMNLHTGKVTVASLATLKDGRANLTLTADATNWDVSNSVVADRRGNTVTLKGAVSLNSGATANKVLDLPVDMRPFHNYTLTIVATDGSPIKLTIQANGSVYLDTKGKNVNLFATYIVD